jgi:hypothetical protein
MSKPPGIAPRWVPGDLSSAHGTPRRLTYAITPPNSTTSPERRRQIADAQASRIAGLPIDALLVYDVQDETARNGSPRPFPFVPKTDPLTYAFDELALGTLPRIVYRAVAQQDESSLRRWLEKLQSYGGHAVLVGAPSERVTPSLTLPRAFSVCRSSLPGLVFGGVIIPERHRAPGDEGARVWAKMKHGCRFFVSQTVWCVDTTKRLLRDLRAKADLEGATAPSISLTLSPCGSKQTMEFLEWLGVRLPGIVKRDLLSARDMLGRSVELASEAFADVRQFAAECGLTIGCNVESVSSRAAEVDAAVELVHRIDRLDANFSAMSSPGRAGRAHVSSPSEISASSSDTSRRLTPAERALSAAE